MTHALTIYFSLMVNARHMNENFLFQNNTKEWYLYKKYINK